MLGLRNFQRTHYSENLEIIYSDICKFLFILWIGRVVYIKRAFKGWSVVRTNNSSGYLMETVNLNIDISGRKHLY